MASTAFACVTFMAEMKAEASEGGTTRQGEWSGQMVPLGAPYHAPIGEAANFCVGAPQLAKSGSLAPGMLAPFRFLSI